MQKILIIASDPLMAQLEEKLRIRFDVETMSVSPSGICERIFKIPALNIRITGLIPTAC